MSGELECLLVPTVSIRTLKAKTGHEKGQLYLTTHRVVWLEAVSSTSLLMFRGKRRAIALPHAHVRAVESHSKGGAVRSAKLKVDLVSPGGQSLVVAVHSHGAADALCHRWRDALAQRAWVPPPAAPSPSSSSSSSTSSTSSSSSSASTPARPVNFTTSSAGVSGLIRTRDEQARATDAALAEAFTDLNALMGKAKDLVGLAERFRVEASRQHEGGDGVTEEESNAFNSYLLSLGIATPVTKQSAGALFHSELARQLCDFLAKPLQHAGGNMSLADVYCLFNRARGTELISPEDLYRACVLLETLGLPLRLRKFDSGVMVIQPEGGHHGR